MEATPDTFAAEAPVLAPAAAGGKGLKAGAIGAVSNVVIGVSSTAPAYSLAATLGAIVAVKGIGLFAPAVLVVSFLPMLCIAFGYYYMNRADPDCGTTFAWVTRAMGPQLGWLNGWVIVAADIVVMASLSQIAGTYTFLLLGAGSLASSTLAVTAVGVVWILGMVGICLIGVELNARTQAVLLGAEVTILTAFAVVAFIKGAATSPPGYVAPSLAWVDPFHIPTFSALINGVLLGLFIYWGWDAGVSVNEESHNSGSGPGRSAVISTLLLVAVFVVVSYAAQSYGGPQFLVTHSSDVLSALGARTFGSGWDKLLILAVLTSASASTQTTILPTARTTLSMARWGAIPKAMGKIHPRYQTPWVSTISFGVVSIAWFVGLEAFSKNVLVDSVTGLGFLIAFYYGFTGLACSIYYRRTLLRSVKNFWFAGVMPLLGFLALGFVFVRAYLNYSHSGAGASPPLLGVQIPIVIGFGSVLLGLVLMIPSYAAYRGGYFRRRPEAAAANALELAPDHQPHLSKDSRPDRIHQL
ncbi:MAG: APC family permease [Solirubrobacteraceae bacterium]